MEIITKSRKKKSNNLSKFEINYKEIFIPVPRKKRLEFYIRYLQLMKSIDWPYLQMLANAGLYIEFARYDIVTVMKRISPNDKPFTTDLDKRVLVLLIRESLEGISKNIINCALLNKCSEIVTALADLNVKRKMFNKFVNQSGKYLVDYRASLIGHREQDSLKYLKLLNEFDKDQKLYKLAIEYLDILNDWSDIIAEVMSSDEVLSKHIELSELK